jgi:hypothetical protein
MAVSHRLAPHFSGAPKTGKGDYQLKNEVSVIGLGMMGSTLAQLLLRHGYRVTVWSRTSAKAEALVRDGADLAPSAAAAVGEFFKHEGAVIQSGNYEISESPWSTLLDRHEYVAQFGRTGSRCGHTCRRASHQEGACHLRGLVERARHRSVGQTVHRLLTLSSQSIYKRGKSPGIKATKLETPFLSLAFAAV